MADCYRCGDADLEAGELCVECQADWEADRVDDSVKSCPDCERPNQFGEVCGSCERDREDEYRDAQRD